MQQPRVQVTIRTISRETEAEGCHRVLLEDVAGSFGLPVIISSYDAMPLISVFENIRANRPQTHDLFTAFINRVGTTLIEASIVRFEKGVFYTKLLFTGLHGAFVIDSRVSDALSLALRLRAPVFVEEEIISELADFKSAAEKPEDNGVSGDITAGRDREIARLEKKLQQLVATECYEKAAIVRDRINALRLEGAGEKS